MFILLLIISLALSAIIFISLLTSILSKKSSSRFFNEKKKSVKRKTSHPNKELLNSSSHGKSIPRFPKTKILFDAGMSNLDHTAENQLNKILELLQSTAPTDLSELEIHITGSADSSGNSSKNKILAKERCLAVKKYMEGKLKKFTQIGTSQLPIIIKEIRVERGNTPRERELLRSVEIQVLLLEKLNCYI